MKVLLLWLHLFAGTDYTVLRYHFSLLGSNEDHVSALLKINPDSNDPVTQAYCAAAEMASAQYKYNPVSKLMVFNSGKSKLDNLVKMYNSNAEIRFIRYAVQLKSPRMLGYNKNIESDKTILLSQLPSLLNTDTGLYKYIKTFMLMYDNKN